MRKSYMKNFILYHLYLLQLENYELPRYWRLICKKGLFPPHEPLRKKLVWTAKAKLLFAGALLFDVIITVSLLTWILILKNFIITLPSYLLFPISSLLDNSPFILIIIPLNILVLLIFIFLFHRAITFLYPIFYTIVLIAFSPFDALIKSIIISRARKKIALLPNLKIIGISGSYGKTTVKEIAADILSQKLNTVKTPYSVNTSLGISRLICSDITEKTDVFIVEMGEHYRGDIKELCSIAQPSISIITGINEAHRERLKNEATTTETIFEIAQYSKPEGTIILNSDDKRVMNGAKTFINNKQKMLYYSSKNSPQNRYSANNIEFLPDGNGISFALQENSRDCGTITIPLIGEYAIGATIAGICAALECGLQLDEAIKNTSQIKTIPHRLQVMKNQAGMIIIDDSYNGNPDGVTEAINALARFENRRKVCITPGLVEMGNATAMVHRVIGKHLNKAADLVILIKNTVTPFIEEGLSEAGFDKTKIHWFNSASDAHQALSTLLNQGDAVLFQNDWGDNYL